METVVRHDPLEQAQAYEQNAAAPDDQTLDLLVNNDGWIDRVEFGWLPEVCSILVIVFNEGDRACVGYLLVYNNSISLCRNSESIH